MWTDLPGALSGDFGRISGRGEFRAQGRMGDGGTAGSAGRENSEAGSTRGSSSEEGRIRKGRRGAITTLGE